MPISSGSLQERIPSYSAQTGEIISSRDGTSGSRLKAEGSVVSARKRFSLSSTENQWRKSIQWSPLCSFTGRLWRLTYDSATL